MKSIIYVLSLITLVNQMSTVRSQHPVIVKIDPTKTKSIKDMDDSELEAKRNAKYDPWWLRGHPDREELIKNYKAWNSCVYSKRPENECENLFEILVAPAQLIIAKLQSYKLYIAETANKHAKCMESQQSEEACNLQKSDRERIVTELKNELYPWSEIFEICRTAKSESSCEYYIKYMHLPENRVMTREGLIQLMKMLVCEDSVEKCMEDLKIPLIEDMEDKITVNTHKKDENDL